MTATNFDQNGRPSGARRTRPVRPQAVETVAGRLNVRWRCGRLKTGLHLQA